jgi:hypothetical protein
MIEGRVRDTIIVPPSAPADSERSRLVTLINYLLLLTLRLYRISTFVTVYSGILPSLTTAYRPVGVPTHTHLSRQLRTLTNIRSYGSIKHSLSILSRGIVPRGRGWTYDISRSYMYLFHLIHIYFHIKLNSNNTIGLYT